MAVLRCERLADGDFDAALARIGPATLARMPSGSFIAIRDELADETARALAFAGIRATSGGIVLEPPAGTRPAVGRDLAPLPRDALGLDLVHVRPLPIGEETKRLMRGGPFRRASPMRRERCRDLLRGRDALIGWRRRAWTSRDVLRSAEARRTLRPIVFDVGAIGTPPEHRALVREALLGRWLFG